MNITELYKRIEDIDEKLSVKCRNGEICEVSALETEKQDLEDVVLFFTNNNLENVDRIILSNIVWDTTGVDDDWPTDAVIDISVSNAFLLKDIYGKADALCYLLDRYEFPCVKFDVRVE